MSGDLSNHTPWSRPCPVHPATPTLSSHAHLTKPLAPETQTTSCLGGWRFMKQGFPSSHIATKALGQFLNTCPAGGSLIQIFRMYKLNIDN